MADNRSDAELAIAFQKGEKEAFTELDRRYRFRLLRFLLKRQLCTKSDVEDRIQSTLFRASKNIHQLNNPERWTPWLFQIAVRICLDEARKNVPIPLSNLDRFTDDQPKTISPDSCQPDLLITGNEARNNIWSAAEKDLSEEEFRILWMFYAEELDLAFIEKTVKKNKGALRTILYRIRKKLAKTLAEQNKDWFDRQDNN